MTLLWATRLIFFQNGKSRDRVKELTRRKTSDNLCDSSRRGRSMG